MFGLASSERVPEEDAGDDVAELGTEEESRAGALVGGVSSEAPLKESTNLSDSIHRAQKVLENKYSNEDLLNQAAAEDSRSNPDKCLLYPGA